MPTLLVLGGTSEIACAIVGAFVRSGWRIQLAGRDLDRLGEAAVRCGGAEVFPFDALDPISRSALWGMLPETPDAVLCAVGLLGDQRLAGRDPEAARCVLESNFCGLVPVLLQAAEAFEARGSGLVIGIGSVAGDRGRASNYAYGAAKAGFAVFLSGLRARLCTSGVRVLTVKPGYVATGMIAGRRLPRCLVASPERVAQDVLYAVRAGRDVIYSPGWWRPLLALYRLLPEWLVKRLPL